MRRSRTLRENPHGNAESGETRGVPKRRDTLREFPARNAIRSAKHFQVCRAIRPRNRLDPAPVLGPNECLDVLDVPAPLPLWNGIFLQWPPIDIKETRGCAGTGRGRIRPMSSPYRKAGHPARDIIASDFVPGGRGHSCDRLMQPITQYCGVSSIHC